jgi:hypothetical protein
MILVAQLPPTSHDPEEVREVADRVLSRPEFGRHEDLLRRLQDWVIDRVGDALSELGAGDGASLLGWIVLGTVIAGVLVLIVRYGRGFRRDPGVGPTATEPRRSATDWRAVAAARSAAGDHRGALQALYRSLIAELSARALVEEIPGRTTGEYRRDIRQVAPSVGPVVDEVTVLFERGVYGPRRPAEPDVARFADLTDDVLAGVRG